MTSPMLGMARRLKTALELLADRPEGLTAGELWDQVVAKFPLNEFEAEPAGASGQPRYGKSAFQMQTIDLVKAGWLRKDQGRWYVTGVGRKALGEHPDPWDFFTAKNTAYRYWDPNRDKFTRDERVVEAVPEGRWAAVTDVAVIIGLEPDRLVAWLQGTRPEGWHRVLDPDGSPPAAAYLTKPERTQWRQLLEKDGLEVIMGRASSNHRMGLEGLRQLTAADPTDAEETIRRAWLVRGSSIRGANLVPEWLAEGFCSLPAAKLRELPLGATYEQVKEAVEEDYAHASYHDRSEKSYEFHAFLTRMREGDLVLTTATGGRAYLGVVAGEPQFVASRDNASNLRRPVRWHREPFDWVDDLPDGIETKLQTQATVVDLTDFVDELAALIGAGGEPETAEARPRELVLPDPTPELAEKLLVDLDWLAEIVDLLRDRPQLVFYGPPGTGKTYLAQAIADHLTGGRPENTVLVQFHPAYSYEDFFEGYRPVATGDGRVALELRPGPFRRLVDRAAQDSATPYVLIIDEINRANLAKVFGELYFLLEYRNRSVDLLYSSGDDRGFSLPRNVVILGTMNTADRSIALVDAAMRRRFAFVELHPDTEPTRSLLDRWLARRGLPDTAARLLRALNARIADRDFRIGPSYLMREQVHTHPRGLERVWRTELLPLLEEHHYGEGVDVEARYGPSALCAELGIDPDTLAGEESRGQPAGESPA